MISTKIEWSFNQIARLQDLSDLAELLFPNNRNQQHAFMAIWNSIKWSPHRIAPNLYDVGQRHGISRRTIERVRSKMRRMGLIDHVSRFNRAYGHQEGWILSRRFGKNLLNLSNALDRLASPEARSRKKDELAMEFARAHSIASATSHTHCEGSLAGALPRDDRN